MSQRVARWIPDYAYEDDQAFFGADDAPLEVVARRRDGFARLQATFASRAPRTLAMAKELEDGISDVAFTSTYRVPFQFRRRVKASLALGQVLEASAGTQVRDLDGNWSYDLGGAYGVNLFGYDFYKGCIERGVERARELGPVLGSYHPVIADNVRRLREISGLDEVSFHMSGTEAVMQAVRLARYHTRRSHVVRLCGAYHGWWDGVQAGVGNPRPPHEVYTLRDLDDATLHVLATRRDIACVLVNPLQALHPNAAAPSDSMLVFGGRSAAYDRDRYVAWLRRLREVCTARGIALIFDEVFLGFRLARGGAQEYFGVRADLVTYGKTLGGGLPVGVVCGTHAWMKRFRDERPTDICFARGTFNSHPYVMTAMNEFLRHVDREEVRAGWTGLDARWDARAQALNARLAERGLPVRVANLASVWTTLYSEPGRYHWMFQYYLRAAGIALSWVGTGRFIFSHDFGDDEFRAVADRFVLAAETMQADGWWDRPPHVTAKWIRRRVLRETLRALLGRAPRPAAAADAPDREAQPLAAPCFQSVSGS
ncbi:MAG: aminotransferase class III-fold pyridoxal phosphate-dependent enzyme [Planctomycetes bacterium]|nr:aminotransferase class III-fold pyridoxal phosphate-dependent enzyme [Planctomycetota bacterium]